MSAGHIIIGIGLLIFVYGTLIRVCGRRRHK